MPAPLRLLCAVLGIWMTAGGCALQKDLYPLYDRINALEQQAAQNERRMTQLKGQFDTFSQGRQQDDQDLRGRSASLSASIERLNGDIQELGGRLEESEHRLRQEMQNSGAGDPKLSERLDRLDESNRGQSEQIARLQQYLNLEPSGKKIAPPGSAGSAAKEPSEEELYALAKRAFDENRLQESLEGFQTYLKKHPRAANADNAQFWIGEIYYREKWYEKAILEYQKVIEQFPKGNKVAAALLKQGLSFRNLKDDSNARLILKELVSKHPNATEAEIGRQQLKSF